MKQAATINSSMRITYREAVDLCQTMCTENPELLAFGARVLGLYRCVRLTMTT